MKKLLTLLAVVILFTGVSYSQNNDTERATLIKKITKSDADTLNPKKSVKYKTWAKRGELFLQAYSLNFKYLYQGMEISSIPFLGISDNQPQAYYGKPLQEGTEGDFAVWTYSRVKLYINPQEQIIDHWKDLDPIDTLALSKSYDAYKKAIELDDQNKFVNKKKTMLDLQTLRDNLMNIAFEYYNNGNSVLALEYLEKSIDLFQYPRTVADTFATVGGFYYYAGIFAYNAKDFTKAKENFNNAIHSDNFNEIGTCHQYISQIMFEEGDTTGAVQFLETGATNYPDEVKIIYSLIDYYTPIGEYDKALDYLDIAISKSPENPILYVVKAGAIEKVYSQLETKYFELLFEADSLDKAIFRASRSNPDDVPRLTSEKEDILNNQVPGAKQSMADYAQKTVDAYQKGIELDTSGTPDYNYSLSLFYYNRANSYFTKSSSIRKLTTIIAQLNTDKDNFLIEAQKFGEIALDLDENDIYTLALLSKIYYKQGNTDKSAEMKQRITDLQD